MSTQYWIKRQGQQKHDKHSHALLKEEYAKFEASWTKKSNPIEIQRDSPKISKTSRSLWATAIGIRSRLPEQPSAWENP